MVFHHCEGNRQFLIYLRIATSESLVITVLRFVGSSEARTRALDKL